MDANALHEIVQIWAGQISIVVSPRQRGLLVDRIMQQQPTDAYVEATRLAIEYQRTLHGAHGSLPGFRDRCARKGQTPMSRGCPFCGKTSGGHEYNCENPLPE
jgi:hypothetical protein